MATLLEIRTRIRQRTDNEHTGDFVTDAELTQLVNTKYAALYGLLVRHSLHRSEATQSITANGATSYPLNADLFGILGVFRIDTASAEKTYLMRHDHRTRPNSSFKGPANTYRVVGGNIEFCPVPSDGTYEILYVPVPGTLSADSDTLDGVLGWEEYIVVAASIDVLVKEDGAEATLMMLRGQLGDLERRIVDEAKAAEMSENITVQDVRSEPVLPGAYNVVGWRGSIRGFYGY